MNRDHIIYQASVTDEGNPQLSFTPDTPQYANEQTMRDLLMLTLQATQDVLNMSDDNFEFLVNDVLAESQERRQENLLKDTDTVKLVTKNLITNQREDFVITAGDVQNLTNAEDVVTITTNELTLSFITNDLYKEIKNPLTAEETTHIPEALGIDHVLYAYKSSLEGVSQLIQYAQANDCYTESSDDDDIYDEGAPDTPEEFEKFMAQAFDDLHDDGNPSNVIPFPKR